MQPIDIMYRTMYAELSQRTFDADDDKRGRYVKVTVKGRSYWYFDEPGKDGRQKRRYVGPDADETIRAAAEQFRQQKTAARQRRSLVTTLLRQARLPGPGRLTGDTIANISQAGVFRQGGVLVGAAAYRCYPAYLGIPIPVETSDDRIEILSSDGDGSGLTDFLVSSPVSATLLHGSGVKIRIPAPERYVVHRLVAASLAREDDESRDRSVAQAIDLMEALVVARRGNDLADAVDEARSRGRGWAVAITTGLGLVTDRRRLDRVVDVVDRELARIGSGPVGMT